MPFKFFPLAFLAIFASCVLASESLDVVGPVEVQPIATHQDINLLSSLINKGFNLQSMAIDNTRATLIQLKVQGNAHDEVLRRVELQQSIARNDLWFFSGALGALLFLQIVVLGLLNKKQRKNIPNPTTQGNNNTNKTAAMELNTKPPSNDILVNGTSTGPAKNTLVTAASGNPLTCNGVSISSIKVDKATLLFEEFLPPQDNGGDNNPISELLTQSRKIKINSLEKLNNPKPYSRPIPLRLTIRPMTGLGNKRSLVATLIRSKIFPTRKVV